MTEKQGGRHWKKTGGACPLSRITREQCRQMRDKRSMHFSHKKKKKNDKKRDCSSKSGSSAKRGQEVSILIGQLTVGEVIGMGDKSQQLSASGWEEGGNLAIARQGGSPCPGASIHVFKPRKKGGELTGKSHNVQEHWTSPRGEKRCSRGALPTAEKDQAQSRVLCGDPFNGEFVHRVPNGEGNLAGGEKRFLD